MKNIFLLLAITLMISCQKKEQMCDYSVKEITYNASGAPISAKEYSTIKPCEKGANFQEGDEKQMKFYTRK